MGEKYILPERNLVCFYETSSDLVIRILSMAMAMDGVFAGVVCVCGVWVYPGFSLVGFTNHGT